MSSRRMPTMSGRLLGATAAGIAVMATLAAPALAQGQRPRASLTPVVSAPLDKSGVARLSLQVSLPADVHVQANKPRDPSLIPTVLSIEVPAGVVVEEIAYPAASELKQDGKSEALLVLGPEFAIDVRVSVASSVPAGTLIVPALLRYQACNESLCFPPARAATQWRIHK